MNPKEFYEPEGPAAYILIDRYAETYFISSKPIFDATDFVIWRMS